MAVRSASGSLATPAAVGVAPLSGSLLLLAIWIMLGTLVVVGRGICLISQACAPLATLLWPDPEAIRRGGTAGGRCPVAHLSRSWK